MKRKKVVIYIPNLSGGGTERFYTKFGEHLSNLKKYSITYFYSIDSDDKKLAKNPYIEFKKTKSSKAFFAVFEIIFSTWKQKYSLFLTAQNNPNVFFSFFKFLLPKTTKLIISEQAFTYLAVNDSKLFTNKIINTTIPYVYKNADYIHCLTSRIAAHLIKNYNVPKTKVVVIPNFVDFSLIAKNAKAKILFANLKNESLNSKFIVSMGRFHTQKGYRIFLDAFSKIANKIPHKLILIGDGPQMFNLKNQVKSLGLSKRVLFPGYLKNPYPIIKKAELFVLSSLYEGLPTVLIEAISLGIPIVSSDCPSGPREILGEKYKDLLYEPQDTNALSELIIRQINNPKKIPIGDIREKFSIKKVLKAHDKLITKCIRIS